MPDQPTARRGRLTEEQTPGSGGYTCERTSEGTAEYNPTRTQLDLWPKATAMLERTRRLLEQLNEKMANLREYSDARRS